MTIETGYPIARENQREDSPRKRNTECLILLALIVAAFAILTVGARNYPLNQQQDRERQIDMIGNLYKDGTYSSYLGVYYYSLCTSAIKAFGASGLIPEESVIQLSIMAVNLSCFLFYAFGAYLVATSLFQSRESRLYFVALAVSIPVIQSQFRYIRCENLLIPMSMFALYFALLIRDHKNRAGLLSLALSILLAVAITQKITALVMLTTCLSVLVFKARPQEHINKAVLITALTGVMCGSLWAFHQAYLTDTPFFQHNAKTHDSTEYFHTPTLDIFLRVNPVDAWNAPMRDHQRDSFANILWLDLYGDYWEYRYNYPIRDLPRDIEERAGATTRGRLGLVLGSIFILAAAVGFLQIRTRDPNTVDSSDLSRRPAWTSPFAMIGYIHRSYPQLLWLAAGAAPILMLIAASYDQAFNPEKLDIAKWEYISWSILFWLIPTLQSAEGRNTRTSKIIRLALLSLCLGGLTQSIY